jgi:hypothetical protein
VMADALDKSFQAFEQKILREKDYWCRTKYETL